MQVGGQDELERNASCPGLYSLLEGRLTGVQPSSEANEVSWMPAAWPRRGGTCARNSAGVQS